MLLSLGHCEIDLLTGAVSTAAGTTRLAEPERRLLTVLAEANGALVPREVLADALGGAALDGVLHRLRARIERDPEHPAVVRTEHGEGVRLVTGSDIVWLHDGLADVRGRWVRRAAGATDLSAKEAALLAYLAERPGRVVGRDELLARVWGVRARGTRTLETTLWRLRRKIEADPATPRHLVTLRGGGTRFDPPERGARVAAAVPEGAEGHVLERHAAAVLQRVRDGQEVPAPELEVAARHLLARRDAEAALEVFRALRETWWAESRHEDIVSLASLAMLVADTAELRWLRAGSHAWLGRWPEAMRDVEAGLRVAGEAPIATQLLLDGASVATALGDPDRAGRMLEQAAGRVGDDDAPGRARVAEGRARHALNQGDPEAARALALEGLTALEQAVRLGRTSAESEPFLHRKAELLTSLGIAHRELGQPETACANFREASGVISRTRASDQLRWVRVHWAAAVADLGRFDEAELRFTELLGEVDRAGSPEDEAVVRFDRAVARALAGRLRQAREDLEQLRALGSVHQVVRGQAALALATVLACLGEPVPASVLLEEGCALLPEPERAYLGLAEVAAGALSAARGDEAEARRRLDLATRATARPFPRVLADLLDAKNV